MTTLPLVGVNTLGGCLTAELAVSGGSPCCMWTDSRAVCVVWRVPHEFAESALSSPVVGVVITNITLIKLIP